MGYKNPDEAEIAWDEPAPIVFPLPAPSIPVEVPELDPEPVLVPA